MSLSKGSLYADGILVSGDANIDKFYCDGIKAEIATITTTKNGTFTSIWKGSGTLNVDWGDGSAVEPFVLTAGGIALNHAFSGGDHLIKLFGALTGVTSIDADFNSISAISGFGNDFKNVTFIHLHRNDLINANSLYGLTKLVTLRLDQCFIVDIQFVASLTSLKTLYLFNNVSISDSQLLVFTTMTQLTTLDLYGTAITDISSLMGLLNLSYLNVANNTLTYTGYTWFSRTSGTFYFGSTVTTPAEVDLWLIDLATANWSNCTIYLDGTNPARTSASDAAVAILAGNGCTLHLN